MCLRMHGLVDSRVYTRLHGTTDLCPGFADGGSGFVATRSYTSRIDLLPSSQESAAEILFSSGVVVGATLRRARLLEHAYKGPHAGHEKCVCDSSALRSLPGCPQQPWLTVACGLRAGILMFE